MDKQIETLIQKDVDEKINKSLEEKRKDKKRGHVKFLYEYFMELL